jgi:hypothetical protein
MNIRIALLRSGSVFVRRNFALLLCLALLSSLASPTLAQRSVAIRLTPGATNLTVRAAQDRLRDRQQEKVAVRSSHLSRALSSTLNKNQDDYTIGVPSVGAVGIQKTTAEIMSEQSTAPPFEHEPIRMLERELPDRSDRPQDPHALPVSSTPTTVTTETSSKRQRGITSITSVSPQEVIKASAAPQTISTSFTGATLADTGTFPPDSMGAVGPSQFVVFVNGRLRTFNKTTGIADGVIDANPDVFFSSVMTPLSGGVTINFTRAPQVRFDRLTRRWILTIIDVPSTSAVSIGDRPNRILVAVSDAASAGTISGGTVWTFYFVQQNLVGVPDTGEFLDYPSLGVDNNALYIGGNMFNALTTVFNSTAGFVIRKSSILSGGPIVTTAFRDLIDLFTGDGPDSPRGVDNYDPAANEGYFMGSDIGLLGRLILLRISDPGGTPSISPNILITVSTTSTPIRVGHLGNTGGVNGNLNAVGDRLFAAHIRNGKLWTAHNIAVTAAGIASSVNLQRRNAVRWYELVVPPIAGAPTVNQSGTIFDPAATVVAARQYWIPSVTVSGQGHAAFGFSTAGLFFRADAATNGRLRTAALGTTGATALYTASVTAYNPPADPGPPRRWGEYSFTSLDPKDDMTMWTIQEFCDAANSYGVRVVKLLAPQPATPTTVPAANLVAGVPSVNVVITGTSVAGSEFYDPGADIVGAEPFNHISASVTGGITVNSVTYTDPNHVTLNISTVGAPAGPKNVTITNPDGQSTTGIGVLTVVGGTTATPGQLNISEFRLRGPGGVNDEFIEIYNASGGALTVSAATGTGFGVVASDGILRCTIPNGTILPNRGHYLCANSLGYSLSAYAAADATYATDIPDNAGIALFNSNVSVNFTNASRLDSVGSSTEVNSIYKEGTGYPAIAPGAIDYSLVRDPCGKGGSNTIAGQCPSFGLPTDTGNNATDFFFVAVSAGVGQRLGAPGPENLASPIQRNALIPFSFLDSTVGSTLAPNRVRDLTPDPVNNSTFGTIAFHRRVVNSSGVAVTRLRFRIVDFTTFPAPAGVADLRARTSLSVVVAGINDPLTCAPGVTPCTVTVQGTTLEVAGSGQPNGGGYNSSLTAGTVTLGTPLAPGASINLRFLMGVQQTGYFKFFINVETLP